jgi:hypothetical protein
MASVQRAAKANKPSFIAGNHKRVGVFTALQHVLHAGKLGGEHIRKRPHGNGATGLRPFHAHVVLRAINCKFDFLGLQLL